MGRGKIVAESANNASLAEEQIILVPEVLRKICCLHVESALPFTAFNQSGHGSIWMKDFFLERLKVEDIATLD